MLVKILEQIPETLFQNVLNEISNIDWNEVVDGDRSKRSVFSTSKSIHLRRHKVPVGQPFPKTINEWSVLVDCIDNAENIKKYPNAYNLAQWIYYEVGGIKMGRIMIVNLLPGGKVAPHIDPLDYFEIHSRFHVPVITNDGVVFFPDPNSEKEHMPVGYLSRLNNRVIHSVENRSNEFRVHLIADIATPGGNVIF